MELRKPKCLSIGRGVENDLELNDLRLSRRHCRFVREGAFLYIEDLGSMNGTRVNGKIVEGRRPLYDGDVVSVGDYRFEVRRGVIHVGPRRRIVLTEESDAGRPDGALQQTAS